MLAALAHPARSAVFGFVRDAGEVGVSIEEVLGSLRMTGSALTFHLRVLADADLIRTEAGKHYSRAGRNTILTVNFDTVAGLIALLKNEPAG